MRKFGLALLFLLAALGGARAQVVTPGATAVDGAIVCVYNATSPVLASGQFGYAQCDQNGKIIISNPGSGGGGGGAVTQGTTPWVDNITQWASVALGAPTNYGTAPTGIVPGVNAFITNPVTNSPSTGATITTSQPSVTTTAASLTFSGTAHREIQNLGTANIYIGGSSVTTTTGFPIPPGTSYDATRFSGTLYAIAASTQSAALISY